MDMQPLQESNVLKESKQQNLSSTYFQQSTDFNIDTQQMSMSLRELYENRVQSLIDSIELAVYKINNDKYVDIMQGDSVSNKFTNQRLGEIIGGTLLKEKEAYISRLLVKLAKYRDKIKKLENSQKLAEENIQELNFICKKEQVAAQQIKARYCAIKHKFQILQSSQQGSYSKSLDKQAWREINNTANLQNQLQQVTEIYEKQKNENRVLKSDIKTLLTKITELLQLSENLQKQTDGKDEMQIEIQELKQKNQRLKQEKENLKHQNAEYHHKFNQMKDNIENKQAQIHAQYDASNKNIQEKYKQKVKVLKQTISNQKEQIESVNKQIANVSQVYQGNIQLLKKELSEIKEHWQNQKLAYKQKIHQLKLEIPQQTPDGNLDIRRELEQKLQMIEKSYKKKHSNPCINELETYLYRTPQHPINFHKLSSESQLDSISPNEEDLEFLQKLEFYQMDLILQS